MASSGSAYETPDFYLACFLGCIGYDLIELRGEGQRKVFVFRDRPKRRSDVLAFYANSAPVNAGAKMHRRTGVKMHHDGLAAGAQLSKSI